MSKRRAQTKILMILVWAKPQVKHGAALENRTPDLLITSGLDALSGRAAECRWMTFLQVSAL